MIPMKDKNYVTGECDLFCQYSKVKMFLGRSKKEAMLSKTRSHI